MVLDITAPKSAHCLIVFIISLECDPQCKQCDAKDGSCTECKPGFTGDHCKLREYKMCMVVTVLYWYFLCLCHVKSEKWGYLKNVRK